VSKAHLWVWKWHSCVSKSHFAYKNHTVQLSIACENPTLRAEITLVRVEITLGRVFWKNDLVLANKYLKIDTPACEFLMQMCHFHTLRFDFNTRACHFDFNLLLCKDKLQINLTYEKKYIKKERSIYFLYPPLLTQL
jgi:hypothetical protein